MNKPKEKPVYSSLSTESNNEPTAQAQKGDFFEIHVNGQLSEIWADWFEGLTIESINNEEMLLSGFVVDQSALIGILNKLLRLNLKLISLKEIKKT